MASLTPCHQRLWSYDLMAL